jgi:hypothetical protein
VRKIGALTQAHSWVLAKLGRIPLRHYPRKIKRLLENPAVKKENRMRKHLMALFVLTLNLSCFSLLLFADETKIEAGRRYSVAEFEQFSEKYATVEIPINNRKLTFYRIYDNTNREFRFRIDKIAVLQDELGNCLDIVGVNWSDREIYDTTFIDNNSCVIAVRFDDVPVMRFLWINSESDKISFFHRNNKYIAYLYHSGHYIYYSTENDYTSIWRIDTKTGIIFTYPVYYPNVELFEVGDNGSKCIYFLYNSQGYLIKGDAIVKTEKKYPMTKPRRVIDFMK